MKKFRTCMIVLLWFAANHQAVSSVPLGGNRKGNGGSYDIYGCMQTNDYYVVNFAAYQFDANRNKDSKTLPQAECIDLPTTGKTQITIDVLDLDVRKKPVALKILREDGQTVAELPLTVVKQGVLSTTVDFKTAGKYQAIFTVDDVDLHTPLEISALHIPLTVALVSEQLPNGYSGLLIMFIIVGIIVAASAYLAPRLLKPKPLESKH